MPPTGGHGEGQFNTIRSRAAATAKASEIEFFLGKIGGAKCAAFLFAFVYVDPAPTLDALAVTM